MIESRVELDFFGSRVAVETHDAPVADEVRRLWKPFLSVDASPPASTPFIDVPDADDPAIRLGWLNSTLNSTAMELSPCLCVHAGVVAMGEQVVAFPGRSGTGKSTLTTACVQQGFDYVSDEALCLEYETAIVRPYPRPIGLSPWSAAALGGGGVKAGDDFLLSAADLGGHSAPVTGRLRLSHLVLLDRRDAGPVALARAPRREAIEALLTMAFNHYKRPADSLALVASVVASAAVSRLTYSNPRDAAGVLATEVMGPSVRRRSP